MLRPAFLSFSRWRGQVSPEERKNRRTVPWIETPIDFSSPPSSPRLHRYHDATPIELFFDLFFVANLTTFTSMHHINTISALVSYIGFLGIIWFTWLQVTLHDIRFARDSIFERICKAFQLATMVGFASAGPSFTMRMTEENFWAFRSLTILLAASRILLALQYGLAANFLRTLMAKSAQRLSVQGAIYFIMSIAYSIVFMGHNPMGSSGSYIWLSWFIFFGAETFSVFYVTGHESGIRFQNTHLNIRMSLLTLIVIGEGVIGVNKIVNRTVGGGGWSIVSFIHILGVTATVYLIWQSYFDISPRGHFGKNRQQIWAALHFPLHVALVLVAEGSEILAITLDISTKLKHLRDTILFACEANHPTADYAIALLNSTIVDMEINFSKGLMAEESAIQNILRELKNSPTLCDTPTIPGALDELRSHDLMANVTTSLFASMGIRASLTHNAAHIGSNVLLIKYLELLFFVFNYYFGFAALSMFIFASFVFLTRQHEYKFFRSISIGYRALSAIFLLSLIALTSDFRASYNYMTSPIVLFTYTLVLFVGLALDRFLDSWAWRRRAMGNDKAGHFVGSDGDNLGDSNPNSDDPCGSLTQLPPIPLDALTSSQPHSQHGLNNYVSSTLSFFPQLPQKHGFQDLELGGYRSTRSCSVDHLSEFVTQPSNSRSPLQSVSSLFVDCRSRFESSDPSSTTTERQKDSRAVSQEPFCPYHPPPLTPDYTSSNSGSDNSNFYDCAPMTSPSTSTSPRSTVPLDCNSSRSKTDPTFTANSLASVNLPHGFDVRNSHSGQSLRSLRSKRGRQLRRSRPGQSSFKNRRTTSQSRESPNLSEGWGSSDSNMGWDDISFILSSDATETYYTAQRQGHAGPKSGLSGVDKQNVCPFPRKRSSLFDRQTDIRELEVPRQRSVAGIAEHLTASPAPEQQGSHRRGLATKPSCGSPINTLDRSLEDNHQRISSSLA